MYVPSTSRPQAWAAADPILSCGIPRLPSLNDSSQKRRLRSRSVAPSSSPGGLGHVFPRQRPAPPFPPAVPCPGAPHTNRHRRRPSLQRCRHFPSLYGGLVLQSLLLCLPPGKQVPGRLPSFPPSLPSSTRPYSLPGLILLWLREGVRERRRGSEQAALHPHPQSWGLHLRFSWSDRP